MKPVDLRGNWEAHISGAPGSYDTCPRDPMSTNWSPPEWCDAQSPVHGWLCTRPKGHDRRHAASTGDFFVAVWS